MSSIETTLILISKYLSIYVDFTIVIIAVIGNILNISVFTQLTIYRRNQFAFYFITESIVGCIQILLLAPSRILTYGFNIDPSVSSIVWCKMRITIAEICGVISAEAVCCASVDQYLSTNYHPRLRQMSSIKLAYCLILIITYLALLHSILFAYSYGVDPFLGCAPINPIFKLYTSFVQYCTVIGLLPITISSIFAVLAYLNVRRIIRHQVPIFRRRLDRQLTAMVLIRVCLYVITTLPFVAYQTYRLNVVPDPRNIRRMAINELIGVICFSIYFLNYSISFYVYAISSTRFRGQVKYFLCKKLWRMDCSIITRENNTARHNQIAPISNISI